MRLLALSFLIAAGCSTSGDPAAPAPPRSPDDTIEVDEVGDEPFASEDDYRQQRQATQARLDAAVGDAQASDVSACRTAPITEQACGGPTAWVVYSEDDGNVASIERLAARLVALDVKANAQFEWASTCMAYTPPQPVLQGGRCVDPNAGP